MSQLKGEFTAEGIEGALGSKFKDVLPEVENASCQAASKQESVDSNTTGVCLIARPAKSMYLLIKSEKTVSDDVPYGSVDCVVVMHGKKLCSKETI